MDQRATEIRALQHAAGQFPGPVIAEPGEADLVGQSVGVFATGAA